MTGDWGADDVAVIESALDWWARAGVDTSITEAPRDWLRPPAREAAPAAVPLAIEPPQPAAPDPFAVAPSGTAAAGLMVLVDMPEPEDIAGGRLLSGPAGRLFDRMLAAIGRERDAVYIASIAATRTPTGRIEAAALAGHAAAARRQVAAAAPRVLVLLGDTTSRAFLEMPVAAARGAVHQVEIEGIPMRAIATFHPRTLLQHPLAKAEAWTDLRRIAQELGA